MTDMIEVKTADLIGRALDYAVCEAEGKFISWQEVRDRISVAKANAYSTEWRKGGPLIGKHRVELTVERDGLIFAELCKEDGMYIEPYTGMYGADHLTSACRAIVAAKLGEVVSAPKELMP